MENSKPIEPKIQKIQILELTQKNFAAIGIAPDLVHQSYPFNRKIFWGFLVLILSLSCNSMYAFREAKTFSEYTQSTHMLSMAVLFALILVVLLLSATQLFNIIDGLENLANTSK